MAQTDRNGASTTPPTPPPQLQEVLDAALAAQAAAEVAALAATNTPVAAPTNAATSKTTPVDADLIPLVDSAASFVLKKLTWANLKATLSNFFLPLSAGGTVAGAVIFNGVNTHSKLVKWAKGADVASATNLTLGTDGNYFDITGTTTIATFATLGVGTKVRLHFDGVLILTNSVDLVLLTEANITTEAGDEAEFVEYATGDWRMVSYERLSGRPLILGTITSFIRLNTSNGHGSSSTCIRRFLNTVVSEGNDVTYTDSATLGASFTINKPGVYSFAYCDGFGAASDFGLSLNSNQLSTGIESITQSARLTHTTTGSANHAATATWVGKLSAGDVVRPHTLAAAGGLTGRTMITVTRLS